VQRGIEHSNKPVKLIQRYCERLVAVISLNPPVQARAFWNVMSVTLEFDEFGTLDDDAARLFSGRFIHSSVPTRQQTLHISVYLIAHRPAP
jgi:hypothetical protein